MSKLTPVANIQFSLAEINPFKIRDTVPGPMHISSAQVRRSQYAAGLTRAEAEDIRCAAIEGQREDELIREAEAAARRARIERCKREIAILEARPADIEEKAYLVHLGVTDLRAEIAILERQG